MGSHRTRDVFALALGLLVLVAAARADDPAGDGNTVAEDLGESRDASKTDDWAVKREEEAIKVDSLNVAQMKEMREKAEKFVFQAEVNRMMKLIINSLYRNKEIFLRELISNASDALDKIRLLSLTEPNVLQPTNELSIKIMADKENKMLHITDTGIGMTKQDLVNNLGTIAKSGTAEFLNRIQEGGTSNQDTLDMIGQFGVGFYSSFLVADTVMVTTKHVDDVQYIWESDATNFSIGEDPRGNTLKRGTRISLKLKDEAADYLDVQVLRDLIKKYSQFINFPIFLWAEKKVKVEEPVEEKEPVKEEKDEDEDSDDVEIEEEKEDEKKTKTVEKTVWDWEKQNDNKPLWTRKPSDVEDDEYKQFYKALTKDKADPLTYTHFVAEGEVSFKGLLFVPATQPSDSFNKYGTATDHIKLFVRRVFITDEFNDMLPKYLAFLQGVVDSDDLPLNVSRETLQQHKLLKVIKKKLVRKALDMIKKLSKEDMDKFWKEYSTNVKLGIIEDPANRTRLAKLLMFFSSRGNELTSLTDYVARMKPKQEHIYYIAGASKQEVQKSPFVERLLKKGYEVVYLVEAVDEYAISSLPEFEGKKFQNVAKEGLYIPEDESVLDAAKEKFEPLIKWLQDDVLKDKISKATVSIRLTNSPCALVASVFGWSGNMERLAISNAHQKSDGTERSYYLNQRKAMEINPGHPIVKRLLALVEENPTDPVAKDTAELLFKTATLRSGYMLQDTASFADSVESLVKQTLGISPDEKVEEFEEPAAEEDAAEESADTDHDEL
ncbi:endoplasmin [Cimex lectularius]|uniref:Heat shock protein 83 n=1 Tax=Cimex lectularius TaxID=79782 RepID=A0A8I6S6T0_CIMLE|nr:endoplasmin [Cimex lectularius]